MLKAVAISNYSPAMFKSEKTHLLCKGKYHSTADLFDSFRIDQTNKFVAY